MPRVESKKIIKKGWLFDKKETYYEEVEVLGENEVIGETTKWKEYLVENKKGKRFVVSKIYKF